MSINPIAPPLFPDTSGCCHIPVRCMGVWNCKLCYRPMELVDTDDGERLKVEMSRVAPGPTAIRLEN